MDHDHVGTSMFRSRGENLRSVYILLFLNISFFLLQYQDGEKFVRLFTFDWRAVAGGEIWRLFTYQFVQAGQVGLLPIPPVVTLFLNLVLLTLMGLAVEEEWGTFHFINFYLVSTLGTAAVAGWLHTPLLGSFFINFTLLFVYASIYRDQTFYLFVALPIRVTFLAWLAFAALLLGSMFGSRANLAALLGAVCGYAYFLWQRSRPAAEVPRGFAPPPDEDSSIMIATRNVTRVSAVKKALATGADSDIDRLIGISEREIVRGVNICSPVDYKPENSDRYCVRCEGFAECTARHLRLNRPKRIEPAIEPLTET
jgi:membrane associated rhomboid family serine protease